MKSIENIYRDMKETFRQKTGIDPADGGDLAVRMYAVAAELHSLYTQADWVARQCFPQTATGDKLDYHAQMRGLQRRAATRAEGVLRFSVPAAAPADLSIPAGTVCLTMGLVRFETTAAATLKKGTLSIDVPARALEAGAQGNVTADSILTMSPAPTGVSACTNPAPFAGGLDAEGDESLRARVLETFKRLPNGANAAFYVQEAMSFDGVAAAVVIPRPRGVGSADVVVTTPAGLPDANLLAQLTEHFQSRREIAVDVAVRAPTTVNVALTVSVAPAEGYSFAVVSQQVDAALRAYFDGTLLGTSILRARLGELIFSVEGVANYSLSAPAADVAVGEAVLPRLTSLTVNQLG